MGVLQCGMAGMGLMVEAPLSKDKERKRRSKVLRSKV